MKSSIREKLILGALLMSVAVGFAACLPPPAVYNTPQPVYNTPPPVQYTQPAPVAQPTTVVYSPQYYNGNVVYFNAQGAPFYYVNSNVYYVPRTYSGYNVLINHYRANRSAYLNWYSSQGVNFRAMGIDIGL